MLESHVQNTTDQFTYIEGQITAISSQIDDMMMEQQQQQQEGFELELKSFSLFGHFGQKGGVLWGGAT